LERYCTVGANYRQWHGLSAADELFVLTT